MYRTVLVAGACVLSLAACSGRDRASTQVAAKVNDREITVHQVNYVLQHTPGLTAERAPQVKKEVVDRLIDQEVLVQQAVANKLDRDPKTLAALEAARREVLSRSYLERAAHAAGKPDAAAIKRYYDENPALFRQRRLYSFNEIVLPARPANWESLEPALAKARTLGETAEVLKAGGVEAPISIDVRRSTEQLPLELVARFAQTRTGEVIIYPAGSAIIVGEIRRIQPAPYSLEEARPLIEHFLTNQDRTAAARNELARLRTAAKVAYQGEFAALAQADGAAAKTGPERGGGEKNEAAKDVPAREVPVQDAPAKDAPADDAGTMMDRGIRGLR